MNEEERIARLKLSLIKGLGPLKFKQIISKYKSAENFWRCIKDAKDDETCRKFIQRFGCGCYDIDIEQFLDDLETRGIHFVVIGEELYSSLLASIYDPPPVIFYKGNIDLLNDTKTISIVGTRNCTSYGKYLTEIVISSLVDQNVSIVSGMAFGIDRLAHEYALENNLSAIAVLASPPDTPSPQGNVDLYNKILSKNGLIISEYHQALGLLKGNFPARNRIIAGVSDSVFIVESPKRSGALITADIAFRENRAVITFPGNIRQSSCEGNNYLIYSQKATMVTNRDQVLDQLGYIRNIKKIETKDLNPFEVEMLKFLSKDPQNEDELKEIFDIEGSDLLASLSLLELRGLIAKTENGKFCVIL